MKEKLFCNEFNKDFKNGPHQKKKKCFIYPHVVRIGSKWMDGLVIGASCSSVTRLISTLLSLASTSPWLPNPQLLMKAPDLLDLHKAGQTCCSWPRANRYRSALDHHCPKLESNYIFKKEAVFLYLMKKVILGRDFPGRPVVKTSPPVQRVWVQSLVGELRWHNKPRGQETKT